MEENARKTQNNDDDDDGDDDDDVRHKYLSTHIVACSASKRLRARQIERERVNRRQGSR